MKRITPIERIRKEIAALMNGVVDRKDDVSSDEEGSIGRRFILLAVQRLIQELLEAERTEFLAREPYERRSDARGWRNGYEPKCFRTPEGKVPVEVPQVRGTPTPFRSELLGLLGSRADVLECLAVEMYARGLSTRDIEEALEVATGEQVLSRTTVSEVTERLWAEFEAFQKRDLSGFELECLFLDAIYEPLRWQGSGREAVLCAWGILRDGRKVLLHLALGNRESEEAWLGLIRSMVERGLVVPLSVTADGAPGLKAAIKQAYPKSLRIRCWAHKMRNIVGKLPREAVAEVQTAVRTVRDAATYEEGKQRAVEVIARYREIYPSAMACLEEDLEASLNHLRLPERLRLLVRTTNLLERTFEEERRRSKVLPRYFTEKSCLKLVFAVLWRASERWCRIRFTPQELEQLDTLRRVLGLAVRDNEELRLQTAQQNRAPDKQFYRKIRT